MGEPKPNRIVRQASLRDIQQDERRVFLEIAYGGKRTPRSKLAHDRLFAPLR